MIMQDKKQICLSIDTLEIGGAENTCVALANDLCAKGWQVKILLLNIKKPVLAEQLDPKIEIVHLNTTSRLRALPRLIAFIRGAQVRNMMIFNYQMALVLIMLRCVFIVKTTIIVRNITVISRQQSGVPVLSVRGIMFTCLKKLYRHADHFIAQSQNMKDDMVKNYHVPHDKITVIHNPAPLYPEVGSIPVAKNKTILCVGRLEKVKAFDTVISLLPDIMRKIPDIRLVIVGEGSMKHEWQNLANDLGVSDQVVFAGASKNVADYYRQADITVLTSLYEGFPNVLVESITLGTPVVSYDCDSGPSEIVIEGTNGFLVRNKDHNHLADSIIKALSQKWNKQGVKESADRFSRNRIFARYETVLKDIIQ